MTAFQKLQNLQKDNPKFLCVGLDTDILKIPKSLGTGLDAVLKFNEEIIEATKDLCCSFKINLAFYEQYGAAGMDVVLKTVEKIPDHLLKIADAKRGDIGNTSTAYAKAFFETFGFDSVTVSPYMGRDSVEPFLAFEDKLIFLLALTSNKGSENFQRLDCEGKPLYMHVIEQALGWTAADNLGFVVGATHADELAEIRKIIPNNALLIPGVGSQGGDAKATMQANGNAPAVVNVSRAVIYASSGNDFAEKAREAAENYGKVLSV
ncbi:MAG: orotidine-5'-phosphate decarboxylase [Bacteroidota bacterium]